MSDTCPATTYLEAMLDETLATAEATEVEAHVAVCETCQQRLEALTSDSALRPARIAVEATEGASSFLDRLAGEPPIAEFVDAGLTTWAAGGSGITDSPAPGAIPGYEILGELGRGGMGVVYRAREARLKRVVALKLLLQGTDSSPELIARFRAEAEAIARLRHPNIVGIHAVGAIEGRPYIEMEYVDGGSLASRLDGTPRPPRDAARLVEALARGLDEVHRLGIIHRDLKPANVLIAADGTPKLGDFGLAKRLDDDSGLTRTGSILGTPSYMAPEQAEGGAQAAGRGSDVYSLGAVFYELLTGRPPFRASSVLETLRLVKSVEPIAPGRLVPGLSRDAETIALKCLEKSPARRYDSAADVAEDLRRFLGDRPILARPIGPVGRLLRWSRRSPVLAGLAAAVVLLLLTVTAVSVTAAVRVAASAAQERKTLYFARMNLVQLAWEANDVRQMRELLAFYADDRGRDDLRGFEWFYWWRLAHLQVAEFPGDPKGVDAIAFSPDGRTIAEAGRGNAIRLLDRGRGLASTPMTVPVAIQALAYSPDGAVLAAGGDKGSIFLWKRGERTPLAVKVEGNGPIKALAFGGDGRTLTVAQEPNINRTIDVDSGRVLGSVQGLSLPTGRIDDVDHSQAHALSSGGRLLAAAALDGSVIVRESATPTARTLLVGEKPARSLAFSPDARTLAVGGEDWTVRLVDLSRSGEPRTLRAHSAPVWSLAFSPNGKILAAAGYDNIVSLWAVPSGQLLAMLKGHGGPVHAVAFSPDGKLVASGGDDATVKLWNAGSGDSGAILSGHSGGVNAVAFSADGSTLATGGREGRVLTWSATTGDRLGPAIEPASADRPNGHPSQVRSLAYSSDGRFLATGGWKAPIHLWDARTLSFIATLDDHPEAEPFIECLSIAPGGSTLASGARDQPTRLWDLATRSLRLTTPARQSARALAFSPDGRTLAATSGDEILLIDVATGRPSEHLKSPGFVCLALAYSGDGKTLAAGGADGTFLLWQVPSGRLLKVQRAHSNQLLTLAFSPDGRTLATAGRDNIVRLWDPETAALKTTLKGHDNNVLALAFSPDGRTLATGSLDRTARLWFSSPR